MKWISRQEELLAVAGQLERSERFAIDTEADSLHSYFDKVCLVQVSIPDEDFIIDPLAKVDLTPLAGILADRRIQKIFHAADYDLRILDRDFRFEVANIFDTMISAQLLGYDAIGLGSLLKKHFNVDVDKSHQRADWARRPLTQSMLVYAAMDTHYLIPLAGILEEELRALDRWEWAEEEFKRLESIRFREGERDPEGFRKVKGSNRLSRRGLALLQRLFDWRDAIARSRDVPLFRVMTNEVMLGVATALPTSLDELKALKGMTRDYVRLHGAEILTMARNVHDLAEESLPAEAEQKPWRRDRELERRVEKLKKVRDRIAGELKVDPALLAPRHVLTAIASIDSPSIEALSEIGALRRWQIGVAGESLVAALRG